MNQTDPNQQSELRDLLHKLNQPLTAIGNYAQAGSAMLAQGSVDQATLQSLFDKINEQAKRGCEISLELAALARAGKA